MSADTINEFHVEGVFPQHSDETTVTGYMAKGAFHAGESVSLISALGVPLLAPISRIGSPETPVNIVRQGQKVALLLKVEPHHVVPGSRLTTRANEEAYGATMIVSAEGAASAAERELKSQPELERAGVLLDIRSFRDAFDVLARFIASRPESCAAHLLMARVFLESDELASKSKALHHVKQAFELGGADDPAVLETLAMALGAHGEAEHGLRYLERLHEKAQTPEARKRYSDKLASYRKRFEVPDHWQFVDQFGAVVFESNKLEDIVKALKNGAVLKDGDCRKNKSGELLAISESLAREYPQVAALYVSPAAGRAFDFGIGACVGLLSGVLSDITISLSPGISASVGAIFAAATVILLGKQRVRQPKPARSAARSL